MTGELQKIAAVQPEEHARVQELNSLAVRGLAHMFDPGKQLFCCRLKLTQGRLKREGLSPRYTMMVLLGLCRAAGYGLRNPFDSETIMNGLLASPTWLDNIGDLGLLLWLCALMAPERFEEVYGAFHVAEALDHYREAKQARTMEMAWFLAGLVHGALAGHRNISGLDDLAHTSFALIKKTQGAKGIFGHLAARSGVKGVLRGHLGTFADQVYPIYALSKFGRAFGKIEALDMAQACAETICKVQGPLGQWWWHYDSQIGRVVGKYPVYSVHQDAMAPMALLALSESTDQDYTPCILKGLRWVYGRNELNFNFCDTSENIVWRGIYLPRSKGYLKKAGSLLGFSPESGTPAGLRVDFEDRPYHFGLVLYAFAQYGFA